MLYKSVANISQNIDNIPSYLKDDIMALLQQVSRYMLRPLSVLNGKIVNVSACKYNLLQQYLEFFRQYPTIVRVYLAGSALTEECRDKSDLDFLIVIKDGVDMDTFIRDTPLKKSVTMIIFSLLVTSGSSIAHHQNNRQHSTGMY